jgi:DNA-binding CsgD family transcriptional regulator
MKTIKEEYFEEKISKFSRPDGSPRKGKGGLSLKKLKATLLAATGATQKEIAELLGIPYGTSRNWHTEKNFRQLIEDHRREIVMRFMKKWREFPASADTFYLEREYEGLWDAFGSYSDYGADLFGIIFAAIIEELNQTRSLLLLDTADLLIGQLLPEESPPLSNLRHFLNIHILAYFFHAARKQNTLKNLSSVERERLLSMFHSCIYSTGVSWRLYETTQKLLDDDKWTDQLRFNGRLEINLKK